MRKLSNGMEKNPCFATVRRPLRRCGAMLFAAKVRYMLMDQEMQLFYDGMWNRAYEYFGAHAMEREGKKGFFFRVWAPHARSVSLVGDFNSWDSSAAPMERSEPGIWTAVVSGTCFYICSMGLQKGVERIVKLMMAGLLFIMIGLAIYAISLPGAAEGLKFYLIPDFQRAWDAGILSLINDAMNQAFFTLSIGIGSMCIFGSYLNKNNTLTKESIFIVSLDTFVALTAGLIIFPACFAFNVTPNAGPGLIFITLPNVFNEMAFGRLWGTLFFVFMSAAALTTVIAVLENIISYFMDNHGWERKKAVCFNAILLTLLTLPCILGFSEWSWIQPLGEGSCIMDLEDFIISNNLLPIGSLIFCLFCCSRYGWGWDNFIAEADEGDGLKFPKALRFYLTKILPVVMIIILAQGYIQKFFM